MTSANYMYVDPDQTPQIAKAHGLVRQISLKQRVENTWKYDTISSDIS